MMEPAVLQARVLSATRGTRLGAILEAVYDVPDRSAPSFHGKANITSDGFLMCDFTATDGQFHRGAFAGEVGDLERNLVGLSQHLNLDETDQKSLLEKVQAWIEIDYRAEPGLHLR